jgi:hypothetical protein
VLTFTPASVSNVGVIPYSIAVGDFNHDGKLDMAVVNFESNSVSVLLGNGVGTFQTAVNYRTGTLPRTVAVGDFNRDGNLDLVVTNAGSANVSILLGNGDGTFRPAVNYATGIAPRSVAVADLNGDGKLDLAVSNLETNNVSILMGVGDGTFQAAVNYAVDTHPRFVAAGDFNGDGKPDLVTANEQGNDVSVLINRGDGTFAPAVNYAVGLGPWSVAVGDFNHDGNLDLVTADTNSNDVSTLLGRGDGTFLPAVRHATAAGPVSVVVADFNRDGSLDVATANYISGTFSVLLGVGDGTFRAAQSAGMPDATTIAVGDFNGDGKPDLAIANRDEGQVTVLLNQPADEIVTGSGPGQAPEVKVFDPRTGALIRSFLAYDPAFRGGVRVALGDVNGDSVPDIITAPGRGMAPEIRVFDGRSGQLIRDFMAYDPAFRGGVLVAAGDVQGDGIADIITGAGPGGGPHVKVFDGADGSLLRSFMAYTPGFEGGVFVAAGDYNGDGRADIITGAGPGGGPHVKVFSGADGSLLESFMAFDVTFKGGVSVAAGDLNGDGLADIVAGAGPGGPPTVAIFRGGDGSLLRSFLAYAPAFTGGVRVATADVNGDGRADIVTGAGPGGGPHVKVFSGADQNLLDGFFAFASTFTGGVFVGGLPP